MYTNTIFFFFIKSTNPIYNITPISSLLITEYQLLVNYRDGWVIGHDEHSNMRCVKA